MSTIENRQQDETLDSKKQAVFQYVDSHREEMLKLWEEVVMIEGGPHEKAGIDAVAARFRQVLESAGAKCRSVEFEQAGNMLIGEIGTDRSQPGVIFLGHMDTAIAAGATAERPFTVKDGKAYGPGVLDMKGGIVAFLYTIKALQAAGYDRRPIKVLLAGDEEVLHAKSGAPEALVAEAAGHAAAFNCETGFMDGGIVVGRKGVARIQMEVKGVAAHAGNDPENGRNAIIELAHKAIEVQGLTDWDKGISFNVGVIEGGTTSTAVPEYAKIFIDVRYKDPDDLPGILQQVEAIGAKTLIEGTSTKVALLDGIKPMKTTDGVKKLYELVEKVSVESGFAKPYPKYVGGGSDSAYTVIAGVPTVCAMGVKGGRNHSPEEFAVVETLYERAKLMAACVLELD